MDLSYDVLHRSNGSNSSPKSKMSSFLHDIAPQSLASSLPLPSSSTTAWGSRAASVSPKDDDSLMKPQAEANHRPNFNDAPAASYMSLASKSSKVICRPSTSNTRSITSTLPFEWSLTPSVRSYSSIPSEHNGSPPSIATIICARCEQHPPSTRCLECNDLFCHDCCHDIDSVCQTRDHSLLPIMHNISPIGVRPNSVHDDSSCEFHRISNEYYCEQCVMFICPDCLDNHRDHSYLPIHIAVDQFRDRVFKTIDSNKVGTAIIRSAIDRTLGYSNALEKNIADINMKIRRAMRNYIETIENRERYLLQKLDQMRQWKITELNEHMTFLRGVLNGLAQVNEDLANSINLSGIDLFLTKEKCDSEVDYYTYMFKNIHVPEPKIILTPPNYNVLNQLKRECEVQIAPEPISVSPVSGRALQLRQSFVSSLQSVQLSPTYKMSPPSSLRAITDRGTPNITIRTQQIGVGQAISGHRQPIQVKMTDELMLGIPTLSFCADGQEEGQVCRPWGICVDKIGNIIVADRRNNRIQVFNRLGRLITMFGSKGSGPGEFELPAGITTDIYGRIVVVDKDNHRVQIFTGYGVFVLTFGSPGHADGQFQYPWDLAVNSRGNIVVGDTRNHRVQMFTSSGVHVASFKFREDKSIPKVRTSPRGVCFTTTGNIIVSDFENHRLLVIDSTLTTILYCVGREGCGIGELNRPSGMVTADNGWIVVTDSKNHRLVIYKWDLKVVTTVDLRSPGFSDKDRPCNVALAPDGRVIVLFETLPESRDKNTTKCITSNSSTIKEYIKVY